MSALQKHHSTHDERRRRAIARIDRDREAMVATLHALRRPLEVVERWQQKALSILPVVPGGLLIVGVAWVLLRVLRGKPAAHAAPRQRRSWLGALVRAMTAYRIALQVRAMLQASSVRVHSGAPSPGTGAGTSPKAIPPGAITPGEFPR